MNRRVTYAILVGLTVIFGVVSGDRSTAAAVAPRYAAWWYQLQADGLPVQMAPPTVPDGGIVVQQGPDGPTAYGALHYEGLADGGWTVMLTLADLPRSDAALEGLRHVQICAADHGWRPPTTSPGAWSSKPGYAPPCVDGALAPDASAIAFNLGSSISPENGLLDVALVPAKDATPFSVTFAKPDQHSLDPASGADNASPQSNAVGTNEAGGNVASVVGATDSTIDAPLVGALDSRIGAAPGPRPELTSMPPVFRPFLRKLSLGDSDRVARAVALSSVAAVVAAFWLVVNRRPAPRRLLRRALREPATTMDLGLVDGGIARFKRMRHGRPCSLR